MRLARSVFFAVLVAVAPPASAATVTLDFEDAFEFDGLGAHYPGVRFVNAVVLAAGSGLNEIEFPPASGVNVVSQDSAGTVDLLFDDAILGFSALFTYANGVLIEAFNAGGTLVDDASPAYASNLATGPNAPNEALSVAGGGIRRIRITGDDYVFDDVMYDTERVVPEPTMLALLLASAVAAARRQRETPAPR